jgi:nucleoside phosphorylase
VREPARKIRIVDLSSQKSAHFLVSQGSSRFFIELFPQKNNRIEQEALPSSNLSIVVPDPPSSDLSIIVPDPPSSNLSIENSSKSETDKRKELIGRKKKSNKMQNKKAPKTDVLIITALPKERDALLTECKNFPGSPDNDWEMRKDNLDRSYYWRSFTRDDGSSFNVATASAAKMGEQSTTNTAQRLALYLRPKCLAMVGICAGNREDGAICTSTQQDGRQEENIRLGDIIIADRVFNFNFGKLKAYYTRNRRQENIFHDLTTYNLCAQWVDAINNLSQQPIEWISSIDRDRPKSDEHQEMWLLDQVYTHQSNHEVYENKDVECPNWDKIINRLWEDDMLVPRKLELTNSGRERVDQSRLIGRQERDPLGSRVHFGPIGTGNQVIRDPQIFKYLQKINCRVLGIEMESNAIGSVAQDLGIPMIVVKGVSDYADHTKNNQFHQYAAETSARFLISFLKTHWPLT